MDDLKNRNQECMYSVEVAFNSAWNSKNFAI